MFKNQFHEFCFASDFCKHKNPAMHTGDNNEFGGYLGAKLLIFF